MDEHCQEAKHLLNKHLLYILIHFFEIHRQGLVKMINKTIRIQSETLHYVSAMKSTACESGIATMTDEYPCALSYGNMLLARRIECEKST